jgi:hypothetical protein
VLNNAPHPAANILLSVLPGWVGGWVGGKKEF